MNTNLKTSFLHGRYPLAVAAAFALAVGGAACAGGRPADSANSPGPAAASEGPVSQNMVRDRSHYESVIEMLRGKVPGLEIVELDGGSIEVRIRGLNQSLQNVGGKPVGQGPLVVVDGVPRSRPAGEVLMALNPRDVVSINVLKDVASTAVYGTRGANGVLLVRLRR